MSGGDDWQVGDLALCVDDGPLKIIDGLPETAREYVEALVKGRVYTVTTIVWGRTAKDTCGIGDKTQRAGGVSTRFRKIRPLSDEERRDALVELKNDQRAPVEAAR